MLSRLNKVVFLFTRTVYGISRTVSEPQIHWKAVNFATSIEGRKLNGSVIKEIEVDSEGSASKKGNVSSTTLEPQKTKLEGLSVN